MQQTIEDFLKDFESENNFDLLFNRMPQSLMLTEFDSGKILKINDFFCSTFGLSASELIGKSTLDTGFWKNSDRGLFTNELITHEVLNGFELTIEDKRGNPVYVLLYSSLVPIGSFKTVLTLVVDISKRKQDEIALQINKEKFKAVFHNNAAPMAIINSDTTIAEVNDTYCRISGYSREEVVGLSWTLQITEDEIDRLKESDQQRLLGPLDVPSEYDTSFYSKQGERKYIHMSISFIPGTKTRIITFVDTTQRKNAEILLAKKSDELKMLVNSKNKEITLNILELSSNNLHYQQINLKLKKIRDRIKSENLLLLQDIDNLIDETATIQHPLDWQRLKEHFMLTRPTFLSGLLNKHPNLTPAEQKLCTLLSLQLSTKEIAIISNQHYDSIRVSRTRLRKKLGLENEDSLLAYLISL